MTLAALAAAAALLMLANLSGEAGNRRMDSEIWQPKLRFDLRLTGDGSQALPNGVAWNTSFGWPLLWHQSVAVAGLVGTKAVGECHSVSRLACNVVLWLAMLASLAGACEWLLRRYPPCLSWNLRTMLLAVGFIAAACGWFAAVRGRAVAQDPIIDSIGRSGSDRVSIEHWGPRWLEVIDAKRYFRRVTGVRLKYDSREAHTQRYHDRLLRLRWLDGLRYLDCEMDGALLEALDTLPRLRLLHVDSTFSRDAGRSRALLAAVGGIHGLEHLSLEWLEIDGGSLPLLAGLEHLKSLDLSHVSRPDKRQGGEPPLLSDLPALARLEAIDVSYADITDDDLACLTALPNLKTIAMAFTNVTDSGLKQLARCNSLEEVAIDDRALSSAGLEALNAIKRLKRLRVNVSRAPLSPTTYLVLDDGTQFDVAEGELERRHRALEVLRGSHPGIRIDGAGAMLEWHEDEKELSQYPVPSLWAPDDSPHIGFWNCWQWRKERW